MAVTRYPAAPVEAAREDQAFLANFAILAAVAVIMALAGIVLWQRRRLRGHDHVIAALDELSGNFSVWDRDGRLIRFNANFKNELAEVAHLASPGLMFEDYIRARVRAGLIADAAGEEAAWIEERLRRHGAPSGDFEVALADGRWHLLRECRTALGGTALFGIDITDRKRAEDARATSERRFKEMVDAGADWRWETGPDDRYVFVSSNFEALTGIACDSVIGRRREDVVDEANLPAWRPLLRMVARREAFREFQCRRRLQDGRTIWLSISGKPHFDAGGVFQGYWGVGRDVTDLVRAREAIRESEARFRDYAESASDAFWETDADHRFTYATRMSRRMWRSPDDLFGKTRWELYGGDPDRDPHWAFLKQEIEAHRPFRDFVYQAPDAAGAPREIRTSGKPVFDDDGVFSGYRGVAVDQTELANTQAELRRNERLLRTFINNFSAATAMLDHDGRVQLVNRAYVEALGESESALVGELVFDIIGKEHARILRAHFREVVETGAAVTQERTALLPDGRPFDRLVTIFPIRDEDDTVTGFGVHAIDISALRQAEERLRQAQRIETVGQLTGGIAHDFNNLLAIIMGNAELLEDRISDDPRLAAILRTATRGAELTQRLLAFSRQQPLNPEPLDVARLIGEMQEILARTLSEIIQVETRVADGLPPALADAAQLENALLNLAINARDAMPNGGRVTIAAFATTLDVKAAAAAGEDVRPGDYVALAVEDDGCGMPADVKARAFEPFFTTKETGAGSGLGLSMVYGFAKQSGGFATIQSAHGDGATITIYLPRAASAVAATDAVGTRPSPQRGKGERILVIEDDPDLRSLAVAMLRELGYAVVDAADATSARSALRSGGRIDLVISDVVLPGGVSGPAFAEEVRAQWPDHKTVFMSGHAASAADWATQQGADVLLFKPFNRAELADAIARRLATGSE